MSDIFGSDTRLLRVPDADLEVLKNVRSGAFYLGGGKRLLDILLVLISLPAVGSLIAICAVLVALDGSSPFYRQKRLGRGGRVFRIWKLRTMVANADEILEKHLASVPEARAEWDEKQKLRHDPRVTRIGLFLRKSSIDELPQVLNVIRGEMSLVGPRPMMPEQRALYSGKSYFLLRPGLTGLWQTSARNTSAFADRVQYDEAYSRDVSLFVDIMLMFRTLRVLARGTGM